MVTHLPERKLNTGQNPYQVKDDSYIVSRFTVRTRAEDGTLLLYNSMTGAMGGVPDEQEAEVLQILEKGYSGSLTKMARDLEEGGIIVPKGINEFKRAEMLRRGLDRTDYLHLILMPSEECNFRCTYCYETFPRGRMEPQVIEGVKKLIASRISKLNDLAISWFGGEPLSEPDILLDITDSFLPLVQEKGINYKGNVTTNGYNLTVKLCEQLVQRGIRTFNITLDGLEEDHDLTRSLRGGGKTFSTIIQNLRDIKQTDLRFKINIRNNFHPKTNIDEFIRFLSDEFSGDDRFHVFFRPVGRWGGGNDSELEVCEGREANTVMFDADLKAVQHDLPVVSLNEFLQPLGSVCYAAKPNSFVIGADGTVYKCTVAFESDFNRVGQLGADGDLHLDFDKLALWVLSGAEDDEVCQRCFFRPSCQGSSCPLVRLESGKRPCPKEKESIKKVLNVLWEQNKKFPDKAAEPMTVGYLD